MHEILLQDDRCRREPSQAHGPETRIIRYRCKAAFKFSSIFFDSRILMITHVLRQLQPKACLAILEQPVDISVNHDRKAATADAKISDTLEGI
ncbi:hypothetical protein WH87_14005 [Devosia epidermidihirudinis]|uniref:Uncharacterized protein n=1 Tax=Devosia epidermidihirudinis TaxID=1293439 RepID=A0A0F5Q6L2_9HYPH|nr:hypothetical protein WH87_14005 [Devosia epidermidihirudinis]